MRSRILSLVIVSFLLLFGCTLLFRDRVALAFTRALSVADKVGRHSNNRIAEKLDEKAAQIKKAFEIKPAPAMIDLDAAKDGPIYGAPDGLKRVANLEKMLHAMQVREEHPRILLTPDNIGLYRERLKDKRCRAYAFNDIVGLAEQGDIVNLAFVYQVLQKNNPATANRCAQQVIEILMKKDSLTGDPRFREQEVAKMALAFDWVYSAMTDTERRYIITKLSKLANIDKLAEDIRKGMKSSGETFHREEWSFNGYLAWPEWALAHHNKNADFVCKARWGYDWYYGDAARMYAYAADGTPFEGYYYGADGVEWLLPLKTAAGINLVDGGDFPWCKNAAYHVLYRLDLERGRETSHHGVALGGGGCVSYREGTVAWKVKSWLGRTLLLANDDPSIKWVVENVMDYSDWAITTVNFGGMPELKPIAKYIFNDIGIAPRKPWTATYEELPYARFFPGGNEAYMRTGWAGRPVIVGLRSSPAYTKTSHGDFDVNTFTIYKDGVLSSDSGIYDAYAGQSSYFSYQKNTVAHNNILVIDPARPDDPKKFSISDPGGVDKVFTRTFGSPSKFGTEDAFLHNPYADWASLVAFKTTPYYDYVVGEAHKAYRDRLDKYYRTIVFIRKGNKAYMVVYDKLKLKKSGLQVKWLMHFVTEPDIAKQKVKTEVPGHIEWFDGNFLKAKNVFNTSELFLKVLKADNSLIRKIGGDGYEYWVDGSKPRNFPVAEKELKRIEEQMGGKWQEAGTWRIELIPQDKKMEYDFINVIYIGDADEPFNPGNVILREDASSYAIEITDEVVPTNIVFLKGEKPRGNIVIKDKISDNFPEIKKR